MSYIRLKSMETLILPIGSYEYHWSLPLNTDTIIAKYISEKLSERINNSKTYPPLNYSVSTEHLERKETISIDPEVFLAYVRNIILSLLKLKPKRIILVNGHGGNRGLLEALITELQYTANEIRIILLDVWSAVQRIIKELFDIEVKSIIHGGLIEASILSACDIKLENYRNITFNEALNMIVEIRYRKTVIIKTPWTISSLKEPAKIYSKELGKKIVTKLLEEIVTEIETAEIEKITPL